MTPLSSDQCSRRLRLAGESTDLGLDVEKSASRPASYNGSDINHNHDLIPCASPDYMTYYAIRILTDRKRWIDADTLLLQEWRP
jgi:hypothetical protein